MQVGEMLWEGQTEAVSTWLDKKCPTQYDVGNSMSQAVVKTAKYREGVAWDAEKLDKLAPIAAFFGAWKVSMETNIMATEAADRATQAIEKLDATAKAFRANTKNDITSMKAASERVQSEVSQMRDRYIAAQDILTSPAFQMAVSNAERLATALESIHRLQGQRIGFALFSSEEKT